MTVFQQTDTALGTKVLLTITPADRPDQIQPLFDALWNMIHDFDASFSRFRWDSELTQFNQRAGKNVEISPKFHKLLVAACQMSEYTAGLFNPFILPALNKAGYKYPWPLTKTVPDFPDYSDRKVVSADNLKLARHTAQIPVNSAIDLGGLGKGYLLDELAAAAEKHGVKDYWFSLGGDIIARGKDALGKPWKISIADATEPDKSIAGVSVPSDRVMAVTTSGVTKRKGVLKGKDWHHIINPTTDAPAETDILTASVVMPKGLLADTYASCLVALGSDNYQAFMKKHGVKDAVIQVAGGGKAIIHGPNFKRL